MRIVLFNWRDRRHPRAGGAEVYTHDLLSELSRQGHHCTFFASSSPGLPREESRDGYQVVRAGNELTCRIHALIWLAKRRNHVDLVIDEVNTLPFLSRLLMPRRTILLMHQLAREVWWKEAPLPLAALGYVLEPLMLQIYRGAPVITISASSMQSFARLGLARDCSIIECPLAPQKKSTTYGMAPHLGYVGRITPSKRVDHVIRAFAVVAQQVPDARLTLVGRGPAAYIDRLGRLAARLGVSNRIVFSGFVNQEQRDELLSSFSCLLIASVREGWGLVVSEAAAYGVPTVAYDVPGLRDSIHDGITGLLAPSGDWRKMAQLVLIMLDDEGLRTRLGSAAGELLRCYSRESFCEKVARAFRAYMPGCPGSA